MSNPLDRFNWLAKYYDFFSRLFFGNKLHHSQLYFLNSIPAGCTILIIGGGTGEMLKHLLMINPSCQVLYIEASGEMISIVRKKIPMEGLDRVRFIHGTEKSLFEQISFDVIITNFFLDMFSNGGVLSICRDLYQKLNKDGLWLVSDFVDKGKWWQRFLLWIMYRFFGLTCKIEGSKLPFWEKQLLSTGLVEMKFQFFYGGFIKSVVYNKIIKN